jgi:hypothetical protein
VVDDASFLSNGLQTLGRQILLLPVSWTADGWYKVPDGITGGNSIAKSHLQPVTASKAIAGFPGVQRQLLFPINDNYFSLRTTFTAISY